MSLASSKHRRLKRLGVILGIAAVLFAGVAAVGSIDTAGASTSRVHVAASIPPAPMPIAACHPSPYRLPANTGFLGRSWCVASADKKSEVYFDSYNNLRGLHYMYGQWYQLWEVNTAGRGGAIYFNANGALQIYSSNYAQLLWDSGTGHASWAGRKKYFVVANGQDSTERLDKATGAVAWRFHGEG